MGNSTISNVGKIFAQGQTADVNGVSSREDIEVAFTDVMSQMAALTGNNLLAGNGLADAGKSPMTTVSDASERQYDRYQYRDMGIKEKQKMNWSEDDQVSQKLDAYADSVKEVLKEELGVSEEQIQEAMETLGLAFIDLMNPNQLAALVVELTGTEDASALLLSSEFMTVMQNVAALSENLLQELGVSAEELTQLLELSQKEEMTDTPQNTEALEILQEPADVPTEEIAAAGTEAVTESPVLQKETPDRMVQDAGQEETEGQKDRSTALPKEQKEVREDVQKTGDAELEETEGAPEKQSGVPEKNHAASGGGQSSQNQHTGNGESAMVHLGNGETVYVQAAESTEGLSSQIDTANIIRQIVEFSKVTLSNTATTMEMQLNPEHLGKIYLEITSREGIVSARITAQNEAVKEALESQIVELRQNMNQAGVKVEAVEVTVGSHEFEKNLEQNAKQEERQAEEQEKAAKQTRRINLNELDELSGIMTEEESLVAQMMADQGNSIDFTA